MKIKLNTKITLKEKELSPSGGFPIARPKEANVVVC
jgi:hypothetical protein